MHPVVRMLKIGPAIVGLESCDITETVEEKRFYRQNSSHSVWRDPSHSAWPWRCRTNSFEITDNLTQRCVCVGCQLNSDQALRLLCLKGHVRARDSTLWRLQLTRSEWFPVYQNTSFFEGVQQPKNRPKTLETLSSTRYSYHVFKIFNSFINWFINLGPKILTSCLLH